mmetsp:Transcript_4987/g.10345  ORF Transcript_4987/g.10345 Transcript_4987/m.10345 type:complete len:83 (+) Transcript_4987:249-497(+)
MPNSSGLTRSHSLLRSRTQQQQPNSIFPLAFLKQSVTNTSWRQGFDEKRQVSFLQVIHPRTHNERTCCVERNLFLEYDSYIL